MNELKLLAIETSGTTGSIALGAGGDVAERTIAAPREQTARILSLVDELLAEAGLKLADLDALIFGRGPGSFTGLRVAAAVVQGLSLASGLPIVPVSSLAALAQRALNGRGPGQDAQSGQAVWGAVIDSGVIGGVAGDRVAGRVLCCTDARMGEVYWAAFHEERGLAVPETEERIGAPAAVEAPAGRFLACGDGFAAYAEALRPVTARAAAVVSAVDPGAPELLVLGAPDAAAGRFVPLASAIPVYLREADAWRRQ